MMYRWWRNLLAAAACMAASMSGFAVTWEDFELTALDLPADGTPQLLDLDRDAVPEIVFWSGERWMITKLGSGGRSLGTVPLPVPDGFSAYAKFEIADLSLDGSALLIVSDFEKLSLFDPVTFEVEEAAARNGSRAGDVTAIDLDLDGRSEILILTTSGERRTLEKWSTVPTLRLLTEIEVPSPANSLHPGVDANGRPVLYVGRGGESVLVFAGNAQEPTEILLESSGSIDTIDLDGSGATDVVGSASFHLDPAGGSDPTRRIVGPAYPSSFRALDLDRDGEIEFVAIDGASPAGSDGAPTGSYLSLWDDGKADLTFAPFSLALDVADLCGCGRTSLLFWQPLERQLAIYSTTDRKRWQTAVVFGNTRGADGARFSSILDVANRSDEPIDLMLRFIGARETLDQVIAVGPHARRRIAAEEDSGIGTLDVGASSAVSGLLSIQSSVGGVEALPLLDRGNAIRYAGLVMATGEGRRNLGLRASVRGAVVGLYLYGSDGTLEKATAISVAPNHLIHVPVTDLFGGSIQSEEALLMSVWEGDVFAYLSTVGPGCDLQTVLGDPL